MGSVLRSRAVIGLTAATVSVTPPRSGSSRLLVAAIDRAGGRSTAVAYDIVAFGGAPSITVVGPQPEWGQQVTLLFAPYPGVNGTVDYTYRVDHGAAQTVTADADGTATISFVANNVYGPEVSVRSHSANGWQSPETFWSVPFYPWPGVVSDVYVDNGGDVGGVGVPGTFTFSPPAGWAEVAGYQHSFNGADPVIVPAGTDRRGTVTWAPEHSGNNYVDVRAVRPDGTLSDYSNFYSFWVA